MKNRGKYLTGTIPAGFFIILFLGAGMSAAQPTGWLDGWGYRKEVNLTENSGGGLTDYQVRMSVVYESNMQSDFSDLRFTDSDGTTLLPYWVEEYANRTSATVWVKVPSIPTQGTTIYMYYGNSSASSESKMWHNVKHLDIYGGVFDYNAVLGVRNYHSRKMQHRLGVSAGYGHACILKSDGDVICYGDNSFGQADDYTEGDAIGVSTGWKHTCILKSDGDVICYGNNSFGQASNYTRGDAVGIAARYHHTCILTSAGNVLCMGDNPSGEADDYTGGDAIGVSAGYGHTCVLKSDGDVICYGDNFFGQADNYTRGDAIGVSAGGSHTCILEADGDVGCYGANFFGQAGYYSGGDAIRVSAGRGHTCILKSDGDVHCYGDASSLEDYTEGDAIGVVTASSATCVLRSNGNVNCYGYLPGPYGDARNPFRKYAFREPTVSLGNETAAAVGAVSGRVIYAHSAEGVAGAVVNLAGEWGVVASATTGSRGNYSLTRVPSGIYRVNVSKIRFWGNSTLDVNLTGLTETVDDIRLWMKGDLNDNGRSADIGDLVLMKRARLGETTANWMHDLNLNTVNADIGDLVLMKRAAVRDILLV